MRPQTRHQCRNWQGHRQLLRMLSAAPLLLVHPGLTRLHADGGLARAPAPKEDVGGLQQRRLVLTDPCTPCLSRIDQSVNRMCLYGVKLILRPSTVLLGAPDHHQTKLLPSATPAQRQHPPACTHLRWPEALEVAVHVQRRVIQDRLLSGTVGVGVAAAGGRLADGTRSA